MVHVRNGIPCSSKTKKGKRSLCSNMEWPPKWNEQNKKKCVQYASMLSVKKERISYVNLLIYLQILSGRKPKNLIIASVIRHWTWMAQGQERETGHPVPFVLFCFEPCECTIYQKMHNTLRFTMCYKECSYNSACPCLS